MHRITSVLDRTTVGLIALASGVYAAITVFWAVSSQILTGVAAAAGIAIILVRGANTARRSNEAVDQGSAA